MALAIQFANIIDHVEDKHNCIVIYFITDADGGSNKGCKLLKKARLLYCSKKVLTSRISSPDKYRQVVLGVHRGVYGPMVNYYESF